jgi:GGDEF domain-containing protein
LHASRRRRNSNTTSPTVRASWPKPCANCVDQIAERERAEQRLVHETLHDSLTGLPNRTFLYDALERALARLHRDPDKHFAVLFLDLDRFKVINDSVGHLVGDEMLKEAGERLAACVRPPDVVARLGGDEFALLLEDTPGRSRPATWRNG